MRRWTRALLLAAGLVVAQGLGAGNASADPHDPQRSGHPLRVLAYTLHPAGVLIDTLVFRPAHWLVHRASLFEGLFGHTD